MRGVGLKDRGDGNPWVVWYGLCPSFSVIRFASCPLSKLIFSEFRGVCFGLVYL